MAALVLLLLLTGIAGGTQIQELLTAKRNLVDWATTSNTSESQGLCNFSLDRKPVISRVWPLDNDIPKDSRFSWSFHEMPNGGVHYNVLRLNMQNTIDAKSIRPSLNGFICPRGGHILSQWSISGDPTYSTDISMAGFVLSDDPEYKGSDSRHSSKDRTLSRLPSPSAKDPSYCPVLPCLQTSRRPRVVSTAAWMFGDRVVNVLVYQNDSANITVTDSRLGIKTELMICAEGSVRHTLSSAVTGKYHRTVRHQYGNKELASQCQISGKLFEVKPLEAQKAPPTPLVPPTRTLLKQPATKVITRVRLLPDAAVPFSPPPISFVGSITEADHPRSAGTRSRNLMTSSLRLISITVISVLVSLYACL